MNYFPFIRTLITISLMLMDYGVAVRIDNDIIGDPDIECLEEEIRIFVKTRKIFNGRIYAKGKADNPACFKDDFAQERTTKPHMSLKFGTCGMKSLRSIDPRGMYYGITIVVSFHTILITKVDQAFHVKCFFEETSRGLNAELGVSMIATKEMEARHPIPGCSYSIHSSSIDDLEAGKPAGPTIKYARVGDRVLHQWHCDDQMFGILINNCYVTDGFGKRTEVIDSNGCSIDPILITSIRYSSDLQRAYGESMVFKFADRPGVWFFCQIQMCMKKDGMCRGITPPSCSSQIENNVYNIKDEEQKYVGRIKPISLTSSSTKSIKEKQKSGINIPGYEVGITDGSVDEYLGERVRPSHISGPNNPIENEESGGIYDDIEFTTLAQNARGNMLSPIIFKPKMSTTTTTTATSTKALVTTILETDEYNTENKHDSKGIGKSIREKEYKESEYEDIKMSSNLNDLLANLPDEVNADSLQKMFHDSVENRRALMRSFDYLMNQVNENEMIEKTTTTTKSSIIRGKDKSGDKIKTIKVSWDSIRLADNPLAEIIAIDQKNRINLMAKNTRTLSPSMLNDDRTSVIAGQLIIYDLDEEPPITSQLKRALTTNSCVISRQGLFIVASSLGTISIALFITTFFMYHRLSKFVKNYQ
ncbi:Cuticlin-6 [Dirofilaria immitis]